MYVVKILGGSGVFSIGNLIYDFSGSSYHYNADFGIDISIEVSAAPISIAKTLPLTIPVGQANNQAIITITNPTATVKSLFSFSDPFPSGLLVTS